jgi:CrcB protein
MNFPLSIVFVFLGGGLGSIARYGITKIDFPLSSKFPLATFITNSLACIILGVILFYAKDKISSNEWVKYFLVIGFCGGFSTFSTFSLETVKLFQDQFYTIAILNILFSLGLGILILWTLTKA